MVAINEDLRKKIVECIKPDERDFISYQNLDLITAVYDNKKDFYLTLSYYLSESIRRSGDNFDDYEYAIITNNNAFIIKCIEYQCIEYRGRKIELTHYNQTNGLGEESIISAIKYRNDHYTERCLIQKAAQEQGIDVYGFTKEYLKSNYWK